MFSSTEGGASQLVSLQARGCVMVIKNGHLIDIFCQNVWRSSDFKYSVVLCLSPSHSTLVFCALAAAVCFATMDNEAMFKQACSVVKEAIDADNAKDYRKAFNLYQKSLTYFAHVIKCKAAC